MIDILFTAWNRREFTMASLAALRANTDWDLVRRLVIIDDGSTDGTREHIDTVIRDWPVDVTLWAEQGIGPVRAMQRYIAADPLPVFAKIDNDVAVPPGWLAAMLQVLDDHPYVELLGMEAGMTAVAGRDGDVFDGVYAFEPATNIGGVGLFRTSAFTSRAAMKPDGRSGFTEFQHTYRPIRGWIRPDLAVPLLDRLPFDPWLSLSHRYVEEGWQRDWPKYSDQWMNWCWQWLPGAAESVGLGDAR